MGVNKLLSFVFDKVCWYVQIILDTAYFYEVSSTMLCSSHQNLNFDLREEFICTIADITYDPFFVRQNKVQENCHKSFDTFLHSMVWCHLNNINLQHGTLTTVRIPLNDCPLQDAPKVMIVKHEINSEKPINNPLKYLLFVVIIPSWLNSCDLQDICFGNPFSIILLGCF